MGGVPTDLQNPWIRGWKVDELRPLNAWLARKRMVEYSISKFYRVYVDMLYPVYKSNSRNIHKLSSIGYLIPPVQQLDWVGTF